MKPKIVAASKNIAGDARFGRNVRISAETVTIGKGAVLGDNVEIEGGEIFIEDGAQIQDRVTISANRFSLGYYSQIEHSCRLMSLDGRAQEVRFGDNSLFGANNSALVPVLLVGDYVKIHNHTLINGLKPCYIGHNSWVGQNSILNSNDVLFIGNNVGIGPYSSIWTHGFFGELIEGFAFNVAPTIIEDDVWIVGAYNVISPGVKAGRRSMILTSSVVTKNVPQGHTVGGVPARDITQNLPPSRLVDLNEKLEMMKGYVKEFVEKIYPNQYIRENDGYQIMPEHREPFRILVQEEFNDSKYDSKALLLLYIKSYKNWKEYPNITVFDLTTKQYTKRRTYPEIQTIKFMTSYRARFVPHTAPQVGVRPDIGL